MSFGDPQWQEWVLKEEESLPLLEHAYKVGINTWDTVLALCDDFIQTLATRLHLRGIFLDPARP